MVKICERAFFNCKNLRKVEIPTNSNLQTIEEDAFLSSKIEDIFIPRNVTKICKGAFSFCYELQIVEISENCELPSLSKELFNDVIIMIPKTSKNINIF